MYPRTLAELYNWDTFHIDRHGGRWILVETIGGDAYMILVENREP